LAAPASPASDTATIEDEAAPTVTVVLDGDAGSSASDAWGWALIFAALAGGGVLLAVTTRTLTAHAEQHSAELRQDRAERHRDRSMHHATAFTAAANELATRMELGFGRWQDADRAQLLDASGRGLDALEASGVRLQRDLPCIEILFGRESVPADRARDVVAGVWLAIGSATRWRMTWLIQEDDEPSEELLAERREWAAEFTEHHEKLFASVLDLGDAVYDALYQEPGVP